MGKLTLSSSDAVYLKDDNDAKSAGKSCSMHVVCVYKSCTHAHKASYGICMCVRISSSAVCVCSAHMYAYKSYTHVRKISSAVCVWCVRVYEKAAMVGMFGRKSSCVVWQSSMCMFERGFTLTALTVCIACCEVLVVYFL